MYLPVSNLDIQGSAGVTSQCLMLVASTIMLVVTGAIFGMMNPSQGTAQAQPEVADLQQRSRVGRSGATCPTLNPIL